MKRGLSSVITTIIFVGLAIIGLTILAAWGIGFIKKESEKTSCSSLALTECAQKAKVEIIQVSYAPQNGETQVTIKNKGEEIDKGFLIILNYGQESCTVENNTALPAYSSKIYTIQSSELESGLEFLEFEEECDVVLGEGETWSSVKVIPRITLIDKEGKECEEVCSQEARVWEGEIETLEEGTPIVSDIPNQVINEGESFVPITLDEYVEDNSPDNEITWQVSGNRNIIVTIDPNRTATLTYQNWTGSETITFTATDPGGLFDSDDATFTVNQQGQQGEMNPLWYIRGFTTKGGRKINSTDQEMLINIGVDYAIFSAYVGNLVVNDFKDLINESGSNMQIGRHVTGISFVGKENNVTWQPYLLHCDNGELVRMGGGSNMYAFDPNRTINSKSFTKDIYIPELVSEFNTCGDGDDPCRYDSFGEFDYAYLMMIETYFNGSCQEEWFDEYENPSGGANHTKWATATTNHIKEVRSAMSPMKMFPNNGPIFPQLNHFFSKRLPVTDGIYHQWLGIEGSLEEQPRYPKANNTEALLELIDEIVARKKYAFLECNVGSPPGTYYEGYGYLPNATEDKVNYCLGVFHLIRNDTYTYFGFSNSVVQLSLELAYIWNETINGDYGWPLGPRYEEQPVGSHIWKREFSNGNWTVNLNQSVHTARFEKKG